MNLYTVVNGFCREEDMSDSVEAWSCDILAISGF